MRSDLLIIGAGGHAESCLDVIESTEMFTVVGLLGKRTEVGKIVLGVPVVGTDDDLSEWVARVPSVLIAVGQLRSAAVRIRLFEAARCAGARFPLIVSSKAYVSRHADVAPGTIIHHGAVVNAGAKVGANGIINTMALIEHNAVIGANCHISTGARVNGEAVVGQGTFIGSSAMVTNGITVGSECIIGAGSIVLKDVPPRTLVRAIV